MYVNVQEHEIILGRGCCWSPLARGEGGGGFVEGVAVAFALLFVYLRPGEYA